MFELFKKDFFPEWGFRPGTTCFPQDMGFAFVNGGMGDYICWMTSIQWLASQATWLHGTLICPVYFKELAEYWLRPHKHWQVKTYTDLDSIGKADTMPMRGPLELQRESLNATGGHLSTCGWVYFTNKEKAPAGWDHYPRIDQADMDKILESEALKAHFTWQNERYAVLTTGITTNSRRVPDGAWNPVIEHIRERGLTPVFLGKSKVETGNQSSIHTAFSDATNYELGLDLRDKTSLLEAAAIMSRAACVIGHDNGLLHLAGCTDVPLVFGYNLASPEHREPKRPSGQVYNVNLTHEELSCNYCQSNMNFVIGFNFKECFYRDMKCMELLFEQGAGRWKRQIDLALTV